ncbi:MAG TPA: hypothetical protein VGL13_00915 [Polyangiaceae bacterium]
MALDQEEHEIDRDALLCALVLSPLTFPRNRFFPLFKLSWARTTRFRASQIRSIVRHLSTRPALETKATAEDEEGRVVVRYAVPDLGLSRTVVLDRLELAMLRFALTRGNAASGVAISPTLVVTDEDRNLVEEALSKLGRKLDLGGTSNHAHPPDGGGT